MCECKLSEPCFGKDDCDFKKQNAVSASALNGLLNAKIKFGLKAQGHLPVVGTMLANGRTWDEIGSAIGWDGATAKEYWLREMQGI